MSADGAAAGATGAVSGAVGNGAQAPQAQAPGQGQGQGQAGGEEDAGVFGSIVVVSGKVLDTISMMHKVWLEQWAPSGVGGWDYHRREMRLGTGAQELHIRRPDGAVIDCLLIPAAPQAPRPDASSMVRARGSQAAASRGLWLPGVHGSDSGSGGGRNGAGPSRRRGRGAADGGAGGRAGRADPALRDGSGSAEERFRRESASPLLEAEGGGGSSPRAEKGARRRIESGASQSPVLGGRGRPAPGGLWPRLEAVPRGTVDEREADGSQGAKGAALLQRLANEDEEPW